MITAPKECPSDAELMRIITAIKVIHGVDVFTTPAFVGGYSWSDFESLRRCYKSFALWVSIEFGEMSRYADAGVEDQSNTGQSTEGNQGGMVLQSASGAVW